jgi:hypothetical protein
MTILGWIFTVIVLVVAMAGFTRWAYDDGVRDGQQQGRQEADKWWLEIDELPHDEEWMKIWREER